MDCGGSVCFVELLNNEKQTYFTSFFSLKHLYSSLPLSCSVTSFNKLQEIKLRLSCLQKLCSRSHNVHQDQLEFLLQYFSLVKDQFLCAHVRSEKSPPVIMTLSVLASIIFVCPGMIHQTADNSAGWLLSADDTEAA